MYNEFLEEEREKHYVVRKTVGNESLNWVEIKTNRILRIALIFAES